MQDAVDRVIAEWQAVDPDLPLGPVEVVNRILRLAPLLERALSTTLAGHGLTLPEFSLLSSLRRRPAPHALPQRDLPGLLGLTPATVSIRVDALEAAGHVRRTTAEGVRGHVVALTDGGRIALEAAVRDHLATQERLVEAIPADDRPAVAEGLRRMSLEHESQAEVPLACGAVVGTRQTTREAFRRLGQPAPDGLLVLQVAAGPATAGRMQVGDVIQAVDGRPVRGLADLAPLDPVTTEDVRCTILRGGDALPLVIPGHPTTA